jgi:mono/diheme cytochrome c family protein
MEPCTKSVNLTTLVAVMVVASSLFGQTGTTRPTLVTAVEGESWIRHVHKSFNETSMGRSSWRLGPAPGEASAWQLRLSPGYAAQVVTLHGSDLYRLSCQGCHGELGHGAPPEIYSISSLVQATSVAAIREQMKKAGREMSESDLLAAAKESKVQLLQRLHHGGEHMLPPTLSEEEIRSLVPYIEQLSGVPGRKAPDCCQGSGRPRRGAHREIHLSRLPQRDRPESRPRTNLARRVSAAFKPYDQGRPPRLHPKSYQRCSHHERYATSASPRQDACLLLLEPGRSRRGL